MGRLSFIAARPAHAEALAPRLRACDVEEIAASSGLSPLAALLASIQVSPVAYAVFFESEVMALLGVGAHPSPGVGVVWLLGSDTIDQHPKLFWRDSRPVLAHLCESYEVLINMVDARNERSLRWLRRLGFTVDQAVPFGVAHLPFHPITLRRDARV